jgi:uncharacterized protein
MKAVSNTTPLRYLIASEQEHLLGQLFEKVFVPVAVHEELTDTKTPETVRHRVSSLPAWFEVRTVQETQATTFPVRLHRGERHAILNFGAVCVQARKSMNVSAAILISSPRRRSRQATPFP